MKDNDKKKPGFLNRLMNRDGKGVFEEEDKRPTFKRFFKLLGRNIGKLLTLNILMLALAIPVAIAIYAFVTGPTQPTQNALITAPLYGLSQFSDSPAFTLEWHMRSGILNWAAFHSSAYIWIGVMAFILLVIWGWVNTGSTFVLRGIVRGDPVFVGSDFFYAIKKNFWSALGLGALDFVIIALLAFDWMFFYNQLGSSFMANLMYVIIIFVIIVYFFMRFYIYPMFVTFKLSLRKLLKNALIFTALGIKRNLMVVLGLAVLTAINVGLMVLLIPHGWVLPMILPFVYYLAFTSFIIVYGSYPVIQKYMIDPYKPKTVSEESAAEEPAAAE